MLGVVVCCCCVLVLGGVGVGCGCWFWTLRFLLAPDLLADPLASVFSFSHLHFHSLCLSLGVFSLNFSDVFEGRSPQMCPCGFLDCRTLADFWALLFGAPPLWGSTMTPTRSRIGLAQNWIGPNWIGPGWVWPEMDWPKIWPQLGWLKLVRSGWQKQDWPTSVSTTEANVMKDCVHEW